MCFKTGIIKTQGLHGIQYKVKERTSKYVIAIQLLLLKVRRFEDSLQPLRVDRMVSVEAIQYMY